MLAHAGGDHDLPPLSWDTFFTRADPFSVITLFLLAAAALYLVGVTRLRRRGDAWSIGRTSVLDRKSVV